MRSKNAMAVAVRGHVKHAAGSAAFTLLIAFSCSAEAQDFLAYQGNNAVQRGQGGTMKTVDGVDIWMSGMPPKRFQVLGSLTDERHKTGLWGLISMSQLDHDITKAAKKAGGDAVILSNAQDRTISIFGSSFGNASGNCSGGMTATTTGAFTTGTANSSCNATGYGFSDVSPVQKHDSSYWVVKYLPDADPATAAGNGVGAGADDKASRLAGINAAIDANQACTQKIGALPEYDAVKDRLPQPGQETIEQLTDASMPTDPQITALKIVYSQSQACRIVFENALSKQMSGTAVLFADYGQQYDNAYLDLLTKKLSWGEFLRKRKGIIDVFTKGMAAQLTQVGLN
jgi:hypothetical protein